MLASDTSGPAMSASPTPVSCWTRQRHGCATTPPASVRDGAALLPKGLEFAVDDGRVDRTPLIATRALVDGLPVQPMRPTTEALRELLFAWVPSEVLDSARSSPTSLTGR